MGVGCRGDGAVLETRERLRVRLAEREVTKAMSGADSGSGGGATSSAIVRIARERCNPNMSGAGLGPMGRVYRWMISN